MPAKPLYMGKCMEDLRIKCQVDFNAKSPKQLIKSLSRILEQAKLERRKGDDEKSYIFFMRWLEIVKWLQKSEEGKNKDFFKPYVTGVLVKEVLKSVEELSKILEKRYAEKSAERNEKKISDTIEKMQIESESSNDAVLADQETELTLRLPETPTDDPTVNHEAENITCIELFKRKEDDKILLIDIRPQVDFEASRIKHDRCINIPAEHIRIGIMATSFKQVLRKNKQAQLLYEKRHKEFVDLVVLFDWHTTLATLSPNNRLTVMKTLLSQWDVGESCDQIVILEGGFAEWLNRYPTLTTNPNVTPPNLLENSLNHILEDVEYPDNLSLSEDEERARIAMTTFRPKRPEPKRNLKPVVVEKKTSVVEKPAPENKVVEQTKSLYDTSNSNHYRSSLLDRSKSLVNTNKFENEKDTSKLTFDQAKPALFDTPGVVDSDHSDEELILRRGKKIHKSIFDSPDDDVVMKPIIDRTSKPSPVKTIDAKSEKILGLMKRLNELVHNQVMAENESLNLEIDIAKREEEGFWDIDGDTEANRRISKINKHMIDMTKEYIGIKEKMNKYSKEEMHVHPAYQGEKSSLELTIGRNEKQITSLQFKKSVLKEARQKQMEERDRQQKGMMTPKTKIGTDVYKVPLKHDGQQPNSGLKRSYSSPNLAQSEDRKESASRWGIDSVTPQVDRTSKPQEQQQHRTYGGTSNTNSIRQSILSSRDREQRMNPIFGEVHPGITGLKNLGNSCYMNSIVQCLSNTAYLAKYFIDGLYTNDLNANNDNKGQSQVVEEVAQVIKFLWSGHYRSISPRDLKTVIGQYKQEFANCDQQDSHEFLTFLLEWMHSDLKKKSKIARDTLLTSAEKEWNASLRGETSIVSHLFVGQLRQTVVCTTCGHNSITYQTYNSLTMSLPETKCNLDDCINRYVSVQNVSEFKCERCKVPREVTKKFDFVKLAPIVVIHLNRFGDTGGWIEKKNIAVDFPLTSFDLKRYLVDADTTIQNSNQHTYDLYAVSSHYGTMEGGHYTAFCKSTSQSKWYKYDDHTVTEVTQGTVKSQTTTAYLLFYTSFPYSGYTM